MARRMLAALAAMSLCSCATIVRGGAPEALNVRSSPVGAEVKVFDTFTGSLVANGKTPFQTMLAKSRGFFQGQKYRVLCEMPGYQPTETIVDTTLNGWYVGGNLVFGGLIGWFIVDPATGAMWSLDPDLLDVQLSPVGAPPPLSPVGAPPPPERLREPVGREATSAEKVPYLREGAQAKWREYLTFPMPRAFAISDSGHYGYAWGTNPRDPNKPLDPTARALQICKEEAHRECTLYSVDTQIVFPK